MERGARRPAQVGPLSPTEVTASESQPRGLWVLVGTEAFDRFSFYGMITLLPLYLNAQLLRPGHVETVLGLDVLRRLLFGAAVPSVIAFGSAIYGLYAGVISIMPLVGGLLGDRLLGARRAVLLGCLLMAAGHALMIAEPYFLAALALLVAGSGLVRANMAAQVASLYGPDDARRRGGFGIYLIGLNIGAMAAPLVAGTLGERAGFHWGFGAAATAMLVAIAVLLAGWRHLPADGRQRGRVRPARLAGRDWRVVGALVLLLLPLVLIATAYNQAFNILLVWASSRVDRDILGFVVPATWLVSVDGLLTIGAIAVAAWVWRRQAAAGRTVSDWTWLMFAAGLQALALLVLAWASWSAGEGLVALWPVLLFFILSDLAVPFYFTIVQATFARAAPVAVVALMMGVFPLGDAASQFMVGALGGLYDRLAAAEFWLVHAGIAASAIVVVLLLRPLIGRVLASGSS